MYDMSDMNRASYRALMGFGEVQEAPTRIWEKREGEEKATWHSMRSHTNSTWIWFMDGFGTLEYQ